VSVRALSPVARTLHDMGDALAGRLDRSRFDPEFDESFEAPILNREHWLPYYLPQWSSRERSLARYEIHDGQLRLRIDEDQPPWCPEFDEELRVSNLQTGVFSGPVGSSRGQHQFRRGLVVREAQDSKRLYTPHFGLVEARVKALADPRCMVALWMIGFEDVPQRSAELCVFEIFGSGMSSNRANVGMGVHPFGDSTVTDEFRTIELAMDATQFHTYSVEWMPGRSLFYVDDEPVARIDQAPNYPLQLMLNVYEFSSEDANATDAYPKEFVVDFVRGYRCREP
jgi:hypothetical protein